MTTTSDRADRRTAVLLSAVAGYVDTAGFLALFGLFTAHVTGNLVTAGAALALRAPEGVAARLAMLPIFMVSVAATTLGARRLRTRGRAPLAPLLAAMAVALAVFWAAGVGLRPWAVSPDAWATITIGGLGVAALGIQNALMREALGTIAPTTVMTGNLTQVTMDLVEMVVPTPTSDPAKRSALRSAASGRLHKFGIPLCGFLVGAALGAWLSGLVGLWSLGVPTVVVAGLTIAAARALPAPARAS